MKENILASKLYDIINKFDLGFIMKQTFAIICKRINLAKISFILCTDSY